MRFLEFCGNILIYIVFVGTLCLITFLSFSSCNDKQYIIKEKPQVNGCVLSKIYSKGDISLMTNKGESMIFPQYKDNKLSSSFGVSYSDNGEPDTIFAVAEESTGKLHFYKGKEDVINGCAGKAFSNY